MSEEKRTAEQVSDEQVMELKIEGLTEEEVKEIQKIFQRFVNKYKENPERETREWLYEQLKEELPEKKEEELQKIAEEIGADDLSFESTKTFGKTKAGSKVGEAVPLFQRIDKAKKLEEIATK